MGEEGLLPRSYNAWSARLDVVGGAGRANQAVGPVFTRVIKVALVLVAMFFALGVARVTCPGATAATLNGGSAAQRHARPLRRKLQPGSHAFRLRRCHGRDLAAGTLRYGRTEGSVTRRRVRIASRIRSVEAPRFLEGLCPLKQLLGGGYRPHNPRDSAAALRNAREEQRRDEELEALLGNKEKVL